MRLLKTALAAAVALVAIVGPASAARADAPGATLYLTWSAPTVSYQVFSVTLTCFPSGGGEEAYFDADLACSAISAAGGDFTALPGWPFVGCTGYSGWAIRTTATGTWLGRSVAYDRTHANICEARRATGWVFLF